MIFDKDKDNGTGIGSRDPKATGSSTTSAKPATGTTMGSTSGSSAGSTTGTGPSSSTGAAAGQAEFAIMGIYIRDLSFEAPHPPENVTTDWAPEVKFELNTQARKLENDNYEVILKLTVTVKRDKKMAFLAEIQQAGMFTLRGFNDIQRGQMLGSFCPNVLYPYARELISNLSTRGGYPPLYLAPVNFDALYADHLNRVQQGGQAAAGQA